MEKTIQLEINGELKIITVNVNKTLLELLREDLKLKGTKKGCN